MINQSSESSPKNNKTKGEPVPVIFHKKKTVKDPLEINVHHKKIDRRVFQQDQISLDKIVQDSESSFYLTGKTTQIGLLNFLQLVSKHDINSIENLHQEEIVISADLITQIAMAEVIDEEENQLVLFEAAGIGFFIAAFLLSGFTLINSSLSEVRSFLLICFLLSLTFLGQSFYRAYHNGQLKKLMRLIAKSLGED